MGLFDKLEKPAPKPLIDEKKMEEVARYLTKDHQVIKDLQVKPLGKVGTYIKGKAYCKLSDTEIDVDIYDDVEIEYVEKCVDAMNSMSDELVDAICRAAKKYCLDFLDEIGGAELNEIDLTIPVDENTPSLELLKCFDIGSLSTDVPKDSSKIGYSLSGNCDWEEEHGIEIVILDGKLVYLGEFSGVLPWEILSGEDWNCAAHIYE